MIICSGSLCGVLNLTALPSDTRFKTNEARSENHDALKSAMETILKTDTEETWHARIEQAGVPVGAVLNVDDTRKLEQIAVRGMVKDVGGRQVPGTPLKFGAFNSLGTMIPSPTLDNCGAAIRAEFAPRQEKA